MEPTTEKVKKPRSRMACKRCHDRRVRCDASAKGVPCTACITSALGEECRLIESRRSRGGNGRFASKAPDATPREQDSPSGLPTKPPATDITSPGVERIRRGSIDNSRSPSSEDDQWSNMVARDETQSAPPNPGRVAYLGESWTLSYVLHWKSQVRSMEQADEPPPRVPGLHLAVPAKIQDSPSPKQATPASVVSAISEGPVRDIQEPLMEAYFTYHNSLYPVIFESEFREAYHSRTVSPLLLTAVLYAGALHVADAVIYRAKYESREACLKDLYLQAKRLFFEDEGDADLGDQLTRVQTAFLLHNMWIGPNVAMDPYTWLGLSIRLAQSMGMHRCTANSSLRPEHRKLWKRIWWSLYSRDRQCASALGKPLMINDIDIDVEPLTIEDFEPQHSMETRLYTIEQANISHILGIIVTTYFTPGRSLNRGPELQAQLKQQLDEWKANVPKGMRYRPGDSHQPFHVLALEVLYNYFTLLLYRPTAVQKNASRSLAPVDNAGWRIAIDAAKAITFITETIMNYLSLDYCPLYFTSSLFGAMTIYTIKGQDVEAQFGICMIAMRTLSTRYFAAKWIRNMFQQLNDKRHRTIEPSRSQPPQASPEPAGPPHPDQAKATRPTRSGDFQHPSSHTAMHGSHPEHGKVEEQHYAGPSETPVSTHGGEPWSSSSSNPTTGVGMTVFEANMNHGVNVLPEYDSAPGGSEFGSNMAFATSWQAFYSAENPFTHHPFMMGGNMEYRV